jgi:hypothetical protein
MLSFRASLAFVLFAALAATPVFGARVHHSAAKSHATHSASTTHTSHAAHSRHARHSADTADSAPVARGSRAAGRRSHKTPAKTRSHGQQAIDSARVTQIQQALIREHYLSGEASGSWDETTRAAMVKYQADQGWQTKLTPDSRALKKLGLGPDYSNAINAKDSSFAVPRPANTIPAEQKQGFAAAAGVTPEQ